MNYCVGFVHNGKHLILIKKQRPLWQKGLLNGVGGKVELGESPVRAMHRECKEECNLSIPIPKWHPFCILHVNKDIVHFFVAEFDISGAGQMTNEKIVTSYAIDSLPDICVYNLCWLIPMALSKRRVFADVIELGETEKG